MKLELGQKVMMFRTQTDPMVGPKPRNAFMMSECGMEAWITDYGVFVKVPRQGTFQGSEHLVPFANIQSIRLELIENESQEEKPRMGRPAKVANGAS